MLNLENKQTLSLLNSEGDILKAIKLFNKDGVDSYVIVDQYRKTVATLSREDLLSYYHGNFDIIDSNGRSYNFKKCDAAKPKMTQLIDFTELIPYRH
jgi:hypothetical protein